MKTGRSEENTLPAGGPALHIPVLLDAVMAALAPRAGGVYLDGTFGAGGYSRALLDVPGTRVLGVDRDPQAIADGAGLVAGSQGRLVLAEGRFGDMAALAASAGYTGIDGIALDIGVSSMQFDQAARGFSFRFDGPLDMRMEAKGRTAADLVNETDEETLANIFYYYGEERQSRRIARAIAVDRRHTPYTGTKALADMIARVCPARPQDIHPATRTFQALRIAVNDELGELARALEAAEKLLKPDGILAIVTFHSLEDRIVKQFFASRSGRGEAVSRLLPGEPPRPAPSFVLDHPVGGRQPVVPSTDEIRLNPRSRSAKLRFGRRTKALAHPVDPALIALASLPQTAMKGR